MYGGRIADLLSFSRYYDQLVAIENKLPIAEGQVGTPPACSSFPTHSILSICTQYYHLTIDIIAPI